jgi:hypothetical protein
VIHGESIGGVAAAGAARKLTESPFLKDKVSLLICDRTFCNLEAVAQRLVGGWSGYAIRALAPFWSTDVAGDFLAATCPKVVANDSADVIISDSSSLKSGIAFWKEIHRGAASTKGIGWVMEAPIQYRMADWENVCVNGKDTYSCRWWYLLTQLTNLEKSLDSQYAQTSFSRTSSPVWPADKHVSLEEGFHFAACVKCIGKIASMEKKKFVLSVGASDPEAGLLAAESALPVFLIWKHLGCCEGLCGAPLGVAVKGGYDCTVAWLCSALTFGGQTVVEGMQHRHNWTDEESRQSLSQLGSVQPSDFDCRPPGYQNQETDTVVHPKPITEVLDTMRKILEENPNDEVLKSGEPSCAYMKERKTCFEF